MIQKVLVLGAGSAGLLAAITLKRKIPQLDLQIIRSPEMGVIGVGESTTPGFPNHLFNYLNLNRKSFYALAEPTWKLGIHFLWGPRPSFDYGFAQQLDAQWADLPRPNGFYCDDDFSDVDLNTALMRQGKAFPRQAGAGGPDIPGWHAFHLHNPKLVKALEAVARELGIPTIDAKVAGATPGPAGLESISLEDGRKLSADFFVDASGFRSELLGRALAEPFVSYERSLFCDRAIVGNWARTTEPILPYTTAETMDAGWSWQIEHEPTVHRGYVYCSDAISDEQARDEFQRKNPRANIPPHVLKFRCGRYQRAWVGNVMAIGNSCGFVEPLEATALMVVCWQARTCVDFLLHTGLSPTPSIQKLFNRAWADTWDEIRDFLTLHFYLNKRLDTPFWRRCRNETDISSLGEMLEFYDENGPTGFARHLLKNTGSQFGIEGFLVMLVGNRHPYRGRHTPTEAEWRIWNNHRAANRQQASNGMDVKEALSYVKHPGWRWHGDR